MMHKVNFVMESGCEDLRPVKQHESDAGFDLKARVKETLPAGGFLTIPTGVYLELPPGFEGQVRPRSGLAAKLGITVLNSPGTVDANYRGEIKVILINHGRHDFEIGRGDRIAQLVIQSLPAIDFVCQNSLNATDRGQGGFGSTGI